MLQKKNYRPDYMRYLIKYGIELEMWNQDPIRYSATVNIKLVESDIYAIKIRFNTLKMKVKSSLYLSFSDSDHTALQQL